MPVVPPLPPKAPTAHRPLIPGVTPEDVAEVVGEAKKQLKAGEFEAAIGAYAAALAMDPFNEEARRGMQEATTLVTARHKDRAKEIEQAQRAREQQLERARRDREQALRDRARQRRVPRPPAPSPSSPPSP
jgi:thioredoxin-like negative regulator of GroEL